MRGAGAMRCSLRSFTRKCGFGATAIRITKSVVTIPISRALRHRDERGSAVFEVLFVGGVGAEEAGLVEDLLLEQLEVQVNHRRHVQRDQLAEQQTADDDETKRAAAG